MTSALLALAACGDASPATPYAGRVLAAPAAPDPLWEDFYVSPADNGSKSAPARGASQPAALRVVFDAPSPQGTLSRVVWSPTGWRLATSTALSMPMNPHGDENRDFTLRVWEPMAPTQPPPMSMPAEDGYGWPYVGWCEFVDHDHVLTAVEGWAGDASCRRISLWHLGRGAIVRQTAFDGSAITCRALDRARGRLWVGTEGGGVFSIDPMLATPAVTHLPGRGGPSGNIESCEGVTALAVEATTGAVAALLVEGDVWSSDPAIGRATFGPHPYWDVALRAGPGWVAAFRRTGARAWPEGGEGGRRMAALADALAAHGLEHLDDLLALADGGIVVGGRAAGVARALWQPRADAPLRALALPNADGARVTALAGSDDGRWLAVGCRDGAVHAFDLAGGSLAPTASSAGQGKRCASLSLRTGLSTKCHFVAAARGDRVVVFAIDL
jgi:hypothetical protein